MTSPAYPAKVDLGSQLDGFYGRHRSGWPYVLSLLARLHTPGGVLLDTFIERTFCWHPDGVRPHQRPWIGIIHVPPGIPDWFQAEQSNARIFRSRAWKKSLPLCRGLFTLSRTHQRSLAGLFTFPVETLLFPTETPDLTWSMEAFTRNRARKIVHVGWWLRRLHSIYQLVVPDYEKIVLQIDYADVPGLMRTERKLLKKQGGFDDTLYQTARSVPFVSNADYDALLAENIVFVDLYDASANNIVGECLVRGTPLLVNRLPAVEEYLGADYPFYFASLAEAAAKAADHDLVRQTHLYLRRHPMRLRLTGEQFLADLTASALYRSL
jgi:hypothetical protein